MRSRVASTLTRCNAGEICDADTCFTEPKKKTAGGRAEECRLVAATFACDESTIYMCAAEESRREIQPPPPPPLTPLTTLRCPNAERVRGYSESAPTS